MAAVARQRHPALAHRHVAHLAGRDKGHHQRKRKEPEKQERQTTGSLPAETPAISSQVRRAFSVIRPNRVKLVALQLTSSKLPSNIQLEAVDRQLTAEITCTKNATISRVCCYFPKWSSDVLAILSIGRAPRDLWSARPGHEGTRKASKK